MTSAYPLQWPDGYKRTRYPVRSKFETTFAVARDEIVKEVKRMEGASLVISTNIPLRQDGLPYANYARLQDTGVAVYFMFKKKQVVLCCDKWDKVEDNMQAIRKALDALRGLDRWGVSEMMDRAFQGFVALPESTPTTPWHIVLGIPETASLQEITTAYRLLAFKHHPDVGGNPDKWHAILRAKEQAVARF